MFGTYTTFALTFASAIVLLGLVASMILIGRALKQTDSRNTRDLEVSIPRSLSFSESGARESRIRQSAWPEKVSVSR